MVYLLAVGSAAAVGCAAYLTCGGFTSAVGRAARRLRFEARLTGGRQGKVPAVIKRLAIETAIKTPGAATLKRRLADAGISAPEATTFWLIVMTLPLTIALAWSLGSVINAAVLIAGAAVGANAWLNKRAGDRLEKFSEQLPAVFKSVAAAINAGSSIQQALLHASDQIGPPAKEELAAVNEQIALGMPIDEALDLLHLRMPAIELDFILLGLSIQRRVGGNLISLLRQTADAIEARGRLRGNLKIETAQARLSATVIGFLPLLVMGLIAIIDPAFIAPMFTTPTGLAMLAIAIVAETAGFLILGRILDVKI